ncbi:YceI family protein [Pontibacter sp. MBLB2868]|uniref:YceI family protein n=1 Tax=Pontibacter sp. MBLB2868 TaxID=3451555 RepID=UPI003F756CB9
MKPLYILLLAFLLCTEVSMAQQDNFQGTGQVTFSAGAPFDLIKGTSSEITGKIDLATGKLYFEIPISTFQFANSMMQERFNDKYMESSRYSKATFTGKLLNLTPDEKQEVTAHGILTVHGVSKKRSIKGVLIKKGNRMILQSAFIVSTKAHHIDPPKLTNAYMADDIDVKLDMLLLPDHPGAGAVSLNQRRRSK